jgi:hypothetical protein
VFSADQISFPKNLGLTYVQNVGHSIGHMAVKLLFKNIHSRMFVTSLLKSLKREWYDIISSHKSSSSTSVNYYSQKAFPVNDYS